MTIETENGSRYVIATNPTGWAAMAKTVRAVDEDKIKDYKEDIDTLLVFTGLFSAVLSAFLIESYKNLSPDKMDTVIQLLGQISNQKDGHTVNTGSITSTQSQSAFTPPLSALRVNELWFASLVVSLATGSLGMLVKQWLREYLAVEFTSPHERLRARQFRHPGLYEWKVFEIAGLLPLLLQLALGLFLLGLCFFTWTAHPGVGNTTTVLVTGWAFLLVGATIAPLCSPRCPYKTALLKNIMITFRRGIRRFLSPTSIRAGVGATLPISTLDPIPNPKQLGFFSREHFIEEEEAVKQESDDVALVAEVDALLLDDELLGTTILDSLTQNNPPSTIINFVLQALKNRVTGTGPARPLTSIPDLRELFRRSWIAISDIVATTILHYLGNHGSDNVAESWLEDAIRLLLSFSIHPLTPKARSALVCCAEDMTASPLWRVMDSLETTPERQHAMSRIHEICDTLSAHICKRLTTGKVNPSEVIRFMLKLQSFDMGQNVMVPQQPLDSILDLRSISRPVWDLSMETISTAIMQIPLKEDKHQDICPWLEDAIFVLLSPSQYPHTSIVYDALAQCIKNRELYLRFGRCVRPLLSPSGTSYPHLMACLRHVSKRLAPLSDTLWLFKEIVLGIKCGPGCTHGPKGSLPLLVHDHLPGHEDWAKHYFQILVDAIEPAMGPGVAFSASVLWSLGALISCPTSLLETIRPDISRAILPLFCKRRTACIALDPFSSSHSEPQSMVVYNVAMNTIISFFTKAEKSDRDEFFHCLWDIADDYVVIPEKSQHDTVRRQNPVRLCALFLKFHSHFLSDISLRASWAKFYPACAKSIKRFTDVKYSSLNSKERKHTIRIAEECLTLLDSIEVPNDACDEEDSTVQDESSLFPDDLFEHLARFVSADTALQFRRVRKLKGKGIQRDTADPSSSESQGPDDGSIGEVAGTQSAAQAEGSSYSMPPTNANDADSDVDADSAPEGLLEALKKARIIPQHVDPDKVKIRCVRKKRTGGDDSDSDVPVGQWRSGKRSGAKTRGSAVDTDDDDDDDDGSDNSEPERLLAALKEAHLLPSDANPDQVKIRRVRRRGNASDSN